MIHVALLSLLAWPAAALAVAEPGTDPQLYAGPAWSPYVVGAGIGILSWFTFYFSNKAIGASGGYASIAGMIGKLFARRHTESLEYYRKEPPQVGWGVMLLLGLVLGSFVSAWTGGELTNRFLPQMWEARFGMDTHVLRGVAAFAGGLLMALGARLAGGCTSGHGISGTLQLAVSSWISVLCFFIGGVVVAMLLYRV